MLEVESNSLLKPWCQHHVSQPPEQKSRVHLSPEVVSDVLLWSSFASTLSPPGPVALLYETVSVSSAEKVVQAALPTCKETAVESLSADSDITGIGVSQTYQHETQLLSIS